MTVNYKRINKTAARNIYTAGGVVYVVPCLVPIKGSVWITAGEIISGLYPDRTFDQIINEYEYYNCNNELGRYTAYYIIDMEVSK